MLIKEPEIGGMDAAPDADLALAFIDARNV
jgi:hypothetical protein